jgi:hypothetical protein
MPLAKVLGYLSINRRVVDAGSAERRTAAIGVRKTRRADATRKKTTKKLLKYNQMYTCIAMQRVYYFVYGAAFGALYTQVITHVYLARKYPNK